MLENKIPPPLYGLTFLLLMWVLHRHFPVVNLIDMPWNYVGPGLILLAIVMDVGALLLFRKADTTVNPLHPQRASYLVTDGIYRFTRNPMYLGLLVILTGWAVYLGSLSPFIVLPLFVWLMTRFQITAEERALVEKFGATYLEYKDRVRRWI